MSLAEIKRRLVRKGMVMEKIFRVMQAAVVARHPIYFDSLKHDHNTIIFEYEGRRYRMELEEL